MENNGLVVGCHAIVFDSTFLKEMGITFDYSCGTIVWDDISTIMKRILNVEINSLNDTDPSDEALPEFMQKLNTKATAIK